MNHETAVEILGAINTENLELKHELIALSVRYARLRADWYLANPDERLVLDTARTAAHNALIDATNILARAMVKAGEDASWRRRLGEDRKGIGDWACYAHAHFGILAR